MTEQSEEMAVDGLRLMEAFLKLSDPKVRAEIIEDVLRRVEAAKAASPNGSRDVSQSM